VNRKVLIVSGPTGSGKSKLGLELAQIFNGEIVSADSVAIYKYFDIGTAKPGSEELSLVTHHLISELEPDNDFSAGEFAKIASERIEKILSAGKTPIVVGGTGLYIRALLNGLISDKREEVTEDISWEQLNEIDPLSASKINQNDQARIKRAFDHFKRIGKSISETRALEEHQELDVNALIVLVTPPREKLYQAINHRSATMLKAGLIEETKRLLANYSPHLKPFGSIGYSHVLRFINGEFLSHQELLNQLSQDTRRFAKRQLTWWRNQPKTLNWTEIQETSIREEITGAARAFLERNDNLVHSREIIRYTP